MASRLTSLILMHVCGLSAPALAQATAPELSRHCEAGSAQSCSMLGLQYVNGDGVVRDAARARELFERACTGGAATGCCNLGVLCAKGLGVRADLRRAARLYERACDQGDAQCCSNAGLVFATGRGQPEDRVRAERYFSRACDAGVPHGCFNLGRLYEKLDAKHASTRVSERAVRAYERGCRGGHEQSCLSVPPVAPSKDQWTPPPGMELAPATKVRLVLKGGKGMVEIDFPPRPWIDDDVVNLIPGEKLLIECGVDGTKLRNLRRVDVVKNADRTLELEFVQVIDAGAPSMMLTVKNPFSQALRYEAAVQLQGTQEFRRTSTIPVQPGLSAYESWPRPMQDRLARVSPSAVTVRRGTRRRPHKRGVRQCHAIPP